MDMDQFFAAIRAKRQKQETESTGEMFLIAGLGNPGREYRESRHNFGFMVMDRLAERLNAEFNKEQQKALVTISPYEGRRLLLVKPLTYMNESGRAVVPLLRYYKIPQDHLFVIHDDMDLPFGTLRVRPNGRFAISASVIHTPLTTKDAIPIATKSKAFIRKPVVMIPFLGFLIRYLPSFWRALSHICI